MNTFWKMFLLTLAVGVIFAIGDAVTGKQVPSASFFECLVIAFLILWCEQADKAKGGKP